MEDGVFAVVIPGLALGEMTGKDALPAIVCVLVEQLYALHAYCYAIFHRTGHHLRMRAGPGNRERDQRGGQAEQEKHGCVNGVVAGQL